ncbi:hypothetical protein ABZ656_12035 [Streptomyces sp. NPDC007095]|uniref:hypothetical protein n=1 Tax=Streptomyces sp. NPDC007095 TaxID=3154482 RepID=UPI0033F6F837
MAAAGRHGGGAGRRLRLAGWLGEVAAGTVGAVVGCLVGLVASGLLYLLVNLAVSGRPPTGPSPPTRD